MAFMASTAFTPGWMVRGVLVMISPIVDCSALPPVRDSARRRSPSTGVRAPCVSVGVLRAETVLRESALGDAAGSGRVGSAAHTWVRRVRRVGAWVGRWRTRERPQQLPPLPGDQQQPEPLGGHLSERIHQQRPWERDGILSEVRRTRSGASQRDGALAAHSIVA